MFSPTLIVSDFYVGKRPAANEIKMRTLPAAVKEAWGRPDFRLDAMTPELKQLAGQSIALDWKTFRMAHDAGVAIMASTDASFANPFIFTAIRCLMNLIAMFRQVSLPARLCSPPRLHRRDFSN